MNSSSLFYLFGCFLEQFLIAAITNTKSVDPAQLLLYFDKLEDFICFVLETALSVSKKTLLGYPGMKSIVAMCLRGSKIKVPPISG